MRKYLLLLLALLYGFVNSVYAQTLFLREEGGKYGYIDAQGKAVVPFVYDFAYTDEFSDSIAFVCVIADNHVKIKAINRKNERLFTVFMFDNGPDYVNEGVFRIVDDSTGLMGFGNMAGDIAIKPQFFFVTPFSDGFASFNEGGKIVAINESDRHSFIDGGKWGFIDIWGNIVFPAIFDSASIFADGKAKVTIGDNVFSIKKK